MKKFQHEDVNDFAEVNYIVIGTANEIKALYKACDRAFMKGNFEYAPMFSDFPKFNKNKLYGLEFYYDKCGNRERFDVLGQDAVFYALCRKNGLETELEEALFA